MQSRARVAAGTLLAALCAASPVRAQDRAPAMPVYTPTGRVTTICAGQRIDSILISSSAPTVAALQRAPRVAALARDIHVTTRPQVIQRYLLLAPGQPCSEVRRAESERILRAQPFIAESNIYVVTNERGGVDLEVYTTDETSIVIGAGLRARAPMVSSFLIGNANIGGEGVFGDFGWRDGDGFRSAFNGRITDSQFLGQAMVATLEGERSEQGGWWHADYTRPFYTDLQRVAWHAQGGMGHTYTEIREPDDLRPAVLQVRNWFDAGAIARLGPPGRFALFGASLTRYNESSGDRLVTGDSGFDVDVGGLPRAYVPHQVSRANVLLGIRDIEFVKRVGLDALTAVEDVPIGLQLGGLVGRSIPALGSRDHDTFVSADLYGGTWSGIGILRLQARGEARQLRGSAVWDGVLTTARLTHTVQFTETQENQVRVEWSGTYRQRTPFQLLLGIPEGGIRGFENSDLAGGQRLVAHIDERYVLGRPLNLADVGIAVFSDVGRQWAGDVPFGVTTPIEGSLGIGLLAAVPPHSQRLWRADLAFPLGAHANSRWTLTVSNADRSSIDFREPNDVRDAREPTVPRSIFAWP